jgi:hypothetical protein
VNFLTAITSWLFGGGGVQTVATAVDKAVYTAEEKAGDDAADLASARTFANVSNQPGFINQIVDAANRLVRPGIVLWLVGGFIGWWSLPRAEAVDPYWQNIFMLVLTFWFGGRAIVKDLPSVIKAMRGK